MLTGHSHVYAHRGKLLGHSHVKVVGSEAFGNGLPATLHHGRPQSAKSSLSYTRYTSRRHSSAASPLLTGDSRVHEGSPLTLGAWRSKVKHVGGAAAGRAQFEQFESPIDAGASNLWRAFDHEDGGHRSRPGSASAASASSRLRTASSARLKGQAAGMMSPLSLFRRRLLSPEEAQGREGAGGSKVRLIPRRLFLSHN